MVFAMDTRVIWAISLPGNKNTFRSNLICVLQSLTYGVIIQRIVVYFSFPFCGFVPQWKPQDSGLGSRSSPWFNTLPVRPLVVPLSKALHAALLLSTQEQMGTCEGRSVSRGAMCVWAAVYSPGSWDGYPDGYMDCKGPMTREGTCQSLHSRALSMDLDSKQ